MLVIGFEYSNYRQTFVHDSNFLPGKIQIKILISPKVILSPRSQKKPPPANLSTHNGRGLRTRLLINDLEEWLERGHGQMNFYLTQVVSSHEAFNTYLFLMKLAESLECTNCDRRMRDDDAWHTLFECLAFQLYQGWGCNDHPARDG